MGLGLIPESGQEFNMPTEIAVVQQVDVVIIGGSSGAVAAAWAAHEAGRSVMLAAPRPYLGDDIAAPFDYWPRADDELATDLARRVLPQGADPMATPPTPMHVKLTLEQALVEAEVPFVLNAHAAGVLRDGAGRIAGAVIATRAGRHAIAAKQVIDATDRSLVARQAGLAFTDPPRGMLMIQHVTIGGDNPPDVADARVEQLPAMVAYHEGRTIALPARRYTLEVDAGGGEWADLAAAYTDVVQRCWAPGEFQHSERLGVTWPDHVAGRAAVDAWPGCDAFDLSALEADAGLHVLGTGACIGREAAEQLCRPAHLMAVGERLGRDVGRRARAGASQTAANPADFTFQTHHSTPIEAGQVRSLDHDLRGDTPAAGTPTVQADADHLPHIGKYDVVVVGGGTGGAPAGISAARAGARTLICEALPALGGVGTLGQITKYWFGNITGFTCEIDAGTAELEADEATRDKGPIWTPQARSAWYLQQARAAGVDVWFGVTCCGAWVEDDRVRGVVVAGPHGYGLVEAAAVVDATGSADVAAHAQAPTRTITADHVAVQGTGLAGIQPGWAYHNTDHGFSDDTDPTDATAFLVSAKRKFADHFDAGQLVDSRERRQIIGDIELEPADFLAQRTFADSICYSSSNFDTHGFTIHPAFMVKPPDKKRLWVYVPYRVLLPRGMDGLLVTGLGVSAHRDAIPVIRMQGDVQNQGYAAGRAAAMAAEAGVGVRSIDIKALQRHLVEIGNLPANVLSDTDSFPVDEATLAEAVGEGWDDYTGLALIFAEADRARPMLRQAFDTTENEQAKLRYAQLLGLMGDAYGADTLRQAVASATWDDGWNYRGMGQFGMSLSAVDALLIALGRCDDARAWPEVLAKLEALGDEPDFSHCRAVGEACEALYPRHADDAAAPGLLAVLDQPGMAGHAHPDLRSVHAALTGNPNEVEVRNRALRELHLARAAYRCGDATGRAETILEQYARDLRGAFARHARAVLHQRR